MEVEPFELNGVKIFPTTIIGDYVISGDPIPEPFIVRVFKSQNGYYAEPEKLFISPEKEKRALGFPSNTNDLIKTKEGAIQYAVSKALHNYSPEEFETTRIEKNHYWKYNQRE